MSTDFWAHSTGQAKERSTLLHFLNVRITNWAPTRLRGRVPPSNQAQLSADSQERLISQETLPLPCSENSHPTPPGAPRVHRVAAWFLCPCVLQTHRTQVCQVCLPQALPAASALELTNGTGEGTDVVPLHAVALNLGAGGPSGRSPSFVSKAFQCGPVCREEVESPGRTISPGCPQGLGPSNLQPWLPGEQEPYAT